MSHAIGGFISDGAMLVSLKTSVISFFERTPALALTWLSCLLF